MARFSLLRQLPKVLEELECLCVWLLSQPLETKVEINEAKRLQPAWRGKQEAVALHPLPPPLDNHPVLTGVSVPPPRAPYLGGS